MSNQVKPLKRTPINRSDLIIAFKDAWIKLFKTVPTKEQLSIIMAQNGLETGGTKSMYNFNIGNIKKTKNDGRDYFMLPHTSEIINGKKIIFEPPHPATWFRSFDTLEEGVIDYLKFVSNGRYSKAWNAVLEGDPKKFSKELKNSGYYTASEELYTKGLTRIYNDIMKDNSFEKNQISSSPSKPKDNDMLSYLNTVLDSFLSAASIEDKGTMKSNLLEEKINKIALYSRDNNFLISINSDNYIHSLEFARVLKNSIYNDLDGNAIICTNGTDIDINCKINGNKNTCKEAIEALSKFLAKKFATITSYNVESEIVSDVKSVYNPIDIKKALSNYRLFILKQASNNDINTTYSEMMRKLQSDPEKRNIFKKKFKENFDKLFLDGTDENNIEELCLKQTLKELGE